MQYLVVIEQGPSSFGAYVPDLPGCVAVGESRAEVTQLIHEAIEFHVEGMKEGGRRRKTNSARQCPSGKAA